ncbi:MAG: FeoC-like transcriptional regulator [Thiofilum sp.]|uniref:FeoC-like transcriptional regulator n=1 Tax=Thiofilum sp. TaxID=2212733 RepID=UPI0025F4EAF2|nr:FeoC-like transcriptional regulator [Thiofilum sp.]MBK8454578.1 hypothetical protein [Thiofilum sp.]
MSLMAIRDYIKQRGQVSVIEVAIHFDLAPETAQLGLDYWMKKGKVRLLNTCGSGCTGCSQVGANNQTYEWCGRAIPLQFNPRRIAPVQRI